MNNEELEELHLRRVTVSIFFRDEFTIIDGILYYQEILMEDDSMGGVLYLLHNYEEWDGCRPELDAFEMEDFKMKYSWMLGNDERGVPTFTTLYDNESSSIIILYETITDKYNDPEDN